MRRPHGIQICFEIQIQHEFPKCLVLRAEKIAKNCSLKTSPETNQSQLQALLKTLSVNLMEEDTVCPTPNRSIPGILEEKRS